MRQKNAKIDMPDYVINNARILEVLSMLSSPCFLRQDICWSECQNVCYKPDAGGDHSELSSYCNFPLVFPFRFMLFS